MVGLIEKYEMEDECVITSFQSKALKNVKKYNKNIKTGYVLHVAYGDFSHVEEDAMLFHPETGELMLGDIMISIDKVYAQAEEYGHSVERELGFLTAHSMLHLCGYDHMEEEERTVMEERQRAIMELVQLYR